MENINLKNEYSLGETITTITPERPELSWNGGDYYFYETPILKNGVQVGTLHETSAEFEYCQISGSFTQTLTLYCPELDLCVELRECSYEDYDGCIPIEDLLRW